MSSKTLQKIIVACLPFLSISCGNVGRYRPYCNLKIENDQVNVLAHDLGPNAGIKFIELYENGIPLGQKNCGGIETAVLVKDINPSEHTGFVYFARCEDLDENNVQSNEEVAYE